MPTSCHPAELPSENRSGLLYQPVVIWVFLERVVIRQDRELPLEKGHENADVS